MDLVAMVQERYFSEALKFQLANGPRDLHLRMADALNLDPATLLGVAAGQATLALPDKDSVARFLGYSLQDFFFLGQDLRSGMSVTYAPRGPLADEPCGCGEDHGHHHHHHHHEGCGCGHDHGGIGDLRGGCGCVKPKA